MRGEFLVFLIVGNVFLRNRHLGVFRLGYVLGYVLRRYPEPYRELYP